jgi:hypothetical protein
MRMKKVCVLFLALLVPMIFMACSGGGGGSSSADPGTTTTTTTNDTTTTAASALTVASKVSVVDAKLTGSLAATAPLRIGLFSARALSFSATSDYNTDKTDIWVDERSTEALSSINDILCMVGQTKYDAMLNKGDYIALVDQNQCNSKSSGGGQSQNQSSSANMPNYMNFVMNSSRADNNSPEIVKAWIHQPKSDHDQAMLIYANIKISEGKTDTNPYGIFAMHFAGYLLDANGNPVAVPKFKGTLEAVRSVPTDSTSKVLLKFIDHETENDSQCGLINNMRAIALDKAAGAGHIKQSRTSTGTCANMGMGAEELGIAFNSSYFFRKDLTAVLPSVCLDRVNFKESSWSYGLYDATGTRVQRNSGFPIVYTAGGKDYHGFIGYWGLWIDNSVTIPNGATVNQVDYHGGSSTSVPYTVFESGGKLKKHTRKNMTLGEIKNLPLGYNEFSQGTNTNYQVVWDGSHFNKVAQMPQNCNGNCTWTNIPQPYPTIDVTHLQWGNLNFWSQNGGGQFQVPMTGCVFTPGAMNSPGTTACDAPTNALPVIFYAEDLVYPGDATVPTSFACYNNCPTVDVNGQAVMSMNMMSGPSNTATTYTFDPAALMLKLAGSPVISTVTSSMQQWGVMTGALFEPSPANMALLACPWNAQQTCTWQAQSELPVYYTWETGPNNWNQFMAIKDSTGAIKKFDPPLQVKYVDANGTTFMLDYSGFGQLNGIPGKCVDMDSGADADCSQGGNGNNSIRWVPQFTIAGLTTVTATDPATNDSTTCYVKPLQIEQRMMQASASACAALVGTDFSSYTLPDASIWSDPVAANGAEHVVTAAPAVIGGVVQ